MVSLLLGDKLTEESNLCPVFGNVAHDVVGLLQPCLFLLDGSIELLLHVVRHITGKQFADATEFHDGNLSVSPLVEEFLLYVVTDFACYEVE